MDRLECQDPFKMLEECCREEIFWEDRLNSVRADALAIFKTLAVQILAKRGIRDRQSFCVVSPAENVRELPRDPKDCAFVTRLPDEVYVVRSDGTIYGTTKLDCEGGDGLITTRETHLAINYKPQISARTLQAILKRLENGEFDFESPKQLWSKVGPSI